MHMTLDMLKNKELMEFIRDAHIYFCSIFLLMFLYCDYFTGRSQASTTDCTSFAIHLHILKFKVDFVHIA